MKPISRSLATLVVVAALLAGTKTASAADFTINVPVNYQNLTEAINAVRLQCSIFVNNPVSAQNLVGTNQVFVNVVGGSVNEVVAVPVDFGQNDQSSPAVDATGFTRQDVVYARCGAMICPTFGAAQGCAYPDAASPDVNYRTAPGTTRTVITGSVALQ